MVRREVLIFGFIVISLWFVFYLDAGEQPYYAYTKLRQELLSEIATLKDRVRDLEKLKSVDGHINVYKVDSAAGTITCRSCRFDNEEKEKK